MRCVCVADARHSVGALIHRFVELVNRIEAGKRI